MESFAGLEPILAQPPGFWGRMSSRGPQVPSADAPAVAERRLSSMQAFAHLMTEASLVHRCATAPRKFTESERLALM